MNKNNLVKLSFLFILSFVLLTVSFATNTTDDTSTEISTPNVDKQIIYEEKNIQEINKNAKIIDQKTKQTDRSIPDDDYTFENEELDITGNQYDGQTLTLLDNVNVISSNNMQLTGTNFVINGNNINITGLKIFNSNWKTEAITGTGSNINIIGNNITVNRTELGYTRGISIVNATNVTVSDNNVYVYAEPQSSGWEYINDTDEYVEHMKVSGIKAENSNNITINNNNVTVTNSTTWGEVNSSADAITLKACNDSNIENNIVTINGSDYIYGVAISRFSNNIYIYNNTALLSGTNYICGIQLASSSNSRIKKNNVYGNCSAESGECPSHEAFAYGIIDLTGTYGANISEAVNNIIEYNNVELDSTIAYAYELSFTDNTQILHNNATVTGNVVMGLGIYNSTNCNITGNLFNITGNTRTLHENITEEISPVTTGIKINGTLSTNIHIIGNGINVTETTDIETFAVIIEDDIEGNVVAFNILKAKYGTTSPKTGSGAVSYDTFSDNIVENNN